MSADAGGRDYYTHESVAALWDPRWKDLARAGKWFAGTEPGEARIDLMFDSYFPYGCNICKLCPLTNTELFKCSKCKVMLYCCKEHQKVDWNRTHKQWCKAFCACRDQVMPMTTPTDFDSWTEYSVRLGTLMDQTTNTPYHTNLRQYSTMQPRCRQCFVAASDGATLISCKECCGVALCESCYEAGSKNVNAFHASSENPEYECEQHFLNLTCMGMVMDHGSPLMIPSDTDCEETFYPSDWHEYFAKKQTDFAQSIPVFMMQLAAVVAFITDGLSTPLTIQHALHQVNQPVQEKLVIHIVGSGICDILAAGRYLELIRLNPNLRELYIVLIGPNMAHFAGQEKPLESSDAARYTVRPSCKTLLSCHQGLYHEVARTLEPPSVIFCPHAGMSDSFYTAKWRPSIEYIGRELPSVPVIVTGYTHEEVVDDTVLLQRWGMHIIEPATPNPFRGLRPFLDPLREVADFHYISASYVVARGA